MKTFFIALILGIFIGSIATNYFASPEAYQKLKESKAALLEQPSPTVPTDTPAEEEQLPPRFNMGSGKIDSEDVPSPMDLSPESETEDAPDTESEADSPVPTPTPAPNTEESEKPEDASPESPEETEAPETSSPTPPSREPEPETPASEPETSEEAPPPATEETDENEESEADETAETPAPSQNVADETDLNIEKAIRTQFESEEQLVSEDIEISIEDRHVTLSGKVPTEDAKRLAIEIAVFTEGVDGVEESLTVEQ